MIEFKPILLKEDPAPPHAMNCTACELSKQCQRVIWGEGNRSAPIFILLDNPGLREDKEGNPFVCGTRQTLQQGLHEAGLELEMVYVSYLLKCRPKRAYDKPLARQTCFSHLQFQFTEKKPRLLLGLGNTVVQTLYPGEAADVKGYRGKWHDFQGIQTVFSYHPLAVRRRPVLYKYFMEDIRQIAIKANEESLI